MKYLKIFIIISFLMFSVSAAAEFYKYVDEEGNTRFTDDINQVPEAQRAKIRSYIESVSEDPSEQEATQENQADQTDQTYPTEHTEQTAQTDNTEHTEKTENT